MSGKVSIPGGFSMLFNSAVIGGHIARAGSSARQVYCAALFLADHGHHHRFRASLETVAKLSGCSRTTARRGLRDLVKAGLMSVLEEPRPSRTREGGTPGLYQLKVPPKVDYFKGLPPLRGWNLEPEGGSESEPGAVKKVNLSRRECGTGGDSRTGADRGSKNATLKQETKTRSSNKSLGETVVLLQGAGLTPEACIRHATQPPERVRAIIASVESRPHVSDRAALIERWLRKKWDVSRASLIAAAESHGSHESPPAEQMLTDAGVGEPKRGELLAGYDHDWIVRRCQDFKLRLEAGERKAPGWLVRAIEQGDYPEHPRLAEREKTVARSQRADADAAARDAERSERAKLEDEVDAWFAETDPTEVEAMYEQWRQSLPPAARGLVSKRKTPAESRPFRAYVAELMEA